MGLDKQGGCGCEQVLTSALRSRGVVKDVGGDVGMSSSSTERERERDSERIELKGKKKRK